MSHIGLLVSLSSIGIHQEKFKYFFGIRPSHRGNSGSAMREIFLAIHDHDLEIGSVSGSKFHIK